MLELGPVSEEAHQQVGKAVARLNPDALLTVGDYGRLIREGAVEAGYPTERAVAFESNDEAVASLLPRRRPGDVILVKGSRGMAMESVVRALRGVGT
jgi:UDP-N-acetylmuramoyl-tripeptide--D-alanyl-D-alanine ligase